MRYWKVSKVISNNEMKTFIRNLNDNTSDSYEMHCTRLDKNLWLIHIGISDRDERNYVAKNL